MGTEFRKGPPSREQVEAALRQGLLWAQRGTLAPFKLMIREGRLVYDEGRPFRALSNMLEWHEDMAAEAWRPIKLDERGVQDFDDAEAVDWSLLDAVATTSPPPQLAVGDVVSLRAWKGCVEGLDYTADSDRLRLVCQTATITAVHEHYFAVKREGIPTTAWLKSHVDLVSPAPKQAPSAQPVTATVTYRGFPTTEQIRAHEANGGVWEIPTPGWETYCHLWRDGLVIRGWHVSQASISRGSGWEVLQRHRDRPHRPVLTDGTPVAWETLGASVPVAAAASAVPALKPGDMVTLRRFSGSEPMWWSSSMDALVGKTVPVISLDTVHKGAIIVKDAQGCPWTWAQGAFDVVAVAAPAASVAAAPTAAPRPFQVGDTVRLGRHEAIDGRRNWNDKMDRYVGQTATITMIDNYSLPSQGGQVVRVDTNEWQWRCCNMELVAAVTTCTAPASAIAAPTASTPTDVPFRPFGELTPAMIAAHKGEWKHPEDETRFYKFERRGDAIFADFRGQAASYFLTGLRPYKEINSRIPSMSWRPVNAADVPVPWATLEAAAQSLQASSVPMAITLSDVRPFTEIPVALFSAHKGEWEEPSTGRIWKVEVRADGVWVDWRSKNGGLTYSTVLEPPGSSRWNSAKKTKLRPIDSTGLPIAWDTLQPSSTPISKLPSDGDMMTVAGDVAIAREGEKQSLTEILSSTLGVAHTVTFIPRQPAPMIHQEINMATTPATTTNPATPAPKSRFRRAVDTASTRVPVELGLNRLHSLIVKKALKGFKGTKQERQVVANFLTGALKSEYGKAAMAGVLAALIPYAAPMVGKHGPFVEAVADECANRGATIIGVEAGGMVLDAIGPLIDIVSSMLSSAEKTHKLTGDVQDAEVAALSPGRGVGVSATEALGLGVAVPAR